MMTALWYIGFSVLVSMPAAMFISMYTEQSMRGKLAAVVIGVVIMHLVGFGIQFVNLGEITIPVWLTL